MAGFLLKRFDFVYPAGGNDFTSVKLTPSELEQVSEADGWCYVCKGWEEQFRTWSFRI